MSDLDQLHEIGELVRQPAFDEILDVRRRRTRALRVATACALLVAAAGAVAVLEAGGGSQRTDPIHPSPSPTPTERLVVPSGQRTIRPDIADADVRGFDALATVTNSQPGHENDSELSATVTIHADGPQAISVYCRGGSDLWWFYDRADGPGRSGRCTPDAATTFAPGVDIDEIADEWPPESLRVRMWIARPSAAYLDCQDQNTLDCDKVLGVPRPVANPSAKFGFGIYEHRPAPALRLFSFQDDPSAYVYEALSSVDQVAWLLERAVTAAPAADRLVFELPPSGEEYLVDVYDAHSPQFERCADLHGDEVEGTGQGYVTALEKVCYASLQLVVDGTPVRPDTGDQVTKDHFSDLGARLAPGAVHRIEVHVVDGDPRNIRFAVIVRTRTQMPEVSPR